MKLARRQYVLVLAVLVLFLPGCFRSESKSVEMPVPIRIGFLLADPSKERYAQDRDAFLRSATRQGAQVTFREAGNQAARQLDQAQEILDSVDVLVVQAVRAEESSDIALLARRAKVPLVAYDRLIRHAPIDAFVTQNSFQVGVLQAEAAVAATGGHGNFVLLMGEEGNSVAEEITRGNLSVLEKHPQIHIVAHRAHAQWSAASAERSTVSALRQIHRNLQAILANNDTLAAGAVRALRAQHLAGKVFVAGADADQAAIRAIAHGAQSMTVVKRVEPLAEAAVAVALKLARHQKLETEARVFNGQDEVSVVFTPVEKFTPGT